MVCLRRIKRLGVISNDQLSWQSNTTFIVEKVFKRMPILWIWSSKKWSDRNLHSIHSLSVGKFCHDLAQLSHKMPKVASHTILNDDYTVHRQHLCKSFAKKCTKSEKTSDMFPQRENIHYNRHPEKYVVFPANTKRLENSTIPYMQRLLNTD